MQPGGVYNVPSDPDLIYIQGNCLTQARYNAMRGVWKHVLEGGGRIVVGSIGIGMGDDPWFEYGGRDFEKYHHFESSPFTNTKDGVWDAHVWLEDRHGNVWDIVTPYMKTVAKLRNKQLDPGIASCTPTVYAGRNKSDCAEQGIHYIATDEVTSDTLATLMVPFVESDLDTIQTTMHS